MNKFMHHRETIVLIKSVTLLALTTYGEPSIIEAIAELIRSFN